MLLTIDHSNRTREHAILRAMFEARKKIFVDLLKWDVPVLAGRFEIDQFDDEHAIYLIVTAPGGRHLGSARLLRTTRPALLDTLFRDLVEGDVPRGMDIFEITRFCLSRDATASERRRARDMLLVGLAEHALEKGVRTYTGVAERSWFEQISAFGWDCYALGPPRIHNGRPLTGLRIDIDAATVAKLASAGISAETGGAVLPNAA